LTHSFPSVSGKSVFEAAGAKLPTPGPSDEEKKRDTADYLTYVATQAVIWSLTDSDKFLMGAFVPGHSSEYNKDEYDAIYTVYRYLQAAAKYHANEESEPTGKLTINPATKSGAVGEKIGPFTVDFGGKVTLSATGGTIVDKNGKPITSLPDGGQFWVKADAAGSVKVHAESSGSVPVGRVFLLKGNAELKSQKLIIGGVAGVTLTADATVTVTVPPASPSASPSAPPSLPITGANVTGAAIGGGVLLIAGAALVLVLRRRRVKFTA
jgi:LPXTG-motif cell wall-anchored protein